MHLKWAKWLAMDRNGKWYWHEMKPKHDSEEWISDGKVKIAIHLDRPGPLESKSI